MNNFQLTLNRNGFSNCTITKYPHNCKFKKLPIFRSKNWINYVLTKRSLFQGSSCCGYGTKGVATKGYDCVIIPGAAKVTGALLKNQAICGKAGLVTMSGVLAGGGTTLCSKAIFTTLLFLLLYHFSYFTIFRTSPFFVLYHFSYFTIFRTLPFLLLYHFYYFTIFTTLPFFVLYHFSYFTIFTTLPFLLLYHFYYFTIFTTLPFLLLYHFYYFTIFNTKTA